MNKKFNKIKKTAKIRIISIILLVALLSISIVCAIPVPHGISGIIYELDGITQVKRGIDFYVHNLNNGHKISGKTGYGSSGRYSVSLKGNDGDAIIIKAWNKYNQVNATLTLSGVMRNVNLLLNMTYPPLAPNITSQPITTATEDRLYTYDVEAFDENEEDILEYNLVEAPTGMKINQSNGLIEWMPLQQHVGSNDVIAQVSDGLFLSNQSFTVNVENVNDRPEIISIPIANATEDVNYFYDVDAIDEDNDLLFYHLITSPNGMIINELNGLINWTPNNDYVGAHQIIVRASDGNLNDEQEFIISAANINDLPVVTSLPITNAVQDKLYNYDADAYDVDDDTLNYSLVNFPQGMSVSNINGNITWLPKNDDAGIHNVTVKISDDEGFVLQPYALIVENVNDQPLINSTPITEAKAGTKYSYDADAYDIDNDALVYSLITSPKDMKIDRGTGLIKWKIRGNDKGNNTVIIEVSDGNLTDKQEYSVYVYSKEQEMYQEESTSRAGKGSSIKKELGQGDKKSLIEISLPLKDVKLLIKELNNRPKDAARISRLVYKYLSIENIDDTGVEEALINFTVPIEWLSEKGIKAKDVVLTRFTEQEWLDLSTINTGQDGNAAHYTAITPGFSYFAISVKEGVEVKNIINPQISKVSIPFKISGTIYKFGKVKQVPRGTKIIIENLNNSDIYIGETGIGPYTGSYYGIIHGNEGDLIRIKIGNIGKEYLTKLKDADNLDFMLNLLGSGFNRITGYGVFEKFTLDKINMESIVFLIFIILLVISIKFKYKKDD